MVLQDIKRTLDLTSCPLNCDIAARVSVLHKFLSSHDQYNGIEKKLAVLAAAMEKLNCNDHYTYLGKNITYSIFIFVFSCTSYAIINDTITITSYFHTKFKMLVSLKYNIIMLSLL